MDKIIRALVADGNVQVTALTTKSLVQRAIQIHHTESSASKILGGMLTAAAYMASGIKNEKGSISLTVKAKGGDGAVSVSADVFLHIRGYADGACTKSLKGGDLTVVREDGYGRPFVGSCEIEEDDISDIIAKYYQQSEQIPTAVAIDVRIDAENNCAFAGGVVIQLLPSASEEAISLAEERLDAYLSGSAASLTADDIMQKFFGDILYGEPSVYFPEYKCNCSESKIKGVLATVGKSELLQIAKEQGEVRVHCHYCNRDYVFDSKRIEEIFNK